MVPSQSGSGVLVGIVSRMGVECFLSALVFLCLFTGGQSKGKFSYFETKAHKICLVNSNDNCVRVGCNFTGNLSSHDTCKTNNGKLLNFSQNNFTGINYSFWEHSTSLRHLNLSSNNISANLTSENIGTLEMLESLDLSENNFSGYLPSAIGNLSKLTTAKLKGNSFTFHRQGNNECFSSSLVYLDLSENKYEMQALPCVNDQSNLTHLDLFNANLTGEISGNLSTLVKLRHLDLSQNNFSADLQDVIRSLPNLAFLNLKGNNIKWNTSCLNGSLEHLDLSRNRFVRKAFPCVKNLVNLTHLHLSHANITGEIPKEISQLDKLKYLLLSDNNLNGSIPNISAMVDLDMLDLSSNNLTGNITGELHSKLMNMSKFNLSYNLGLQVCSSFFRGKQSSIIKLKEINCTTEGENQKPGGNGSVGSKSKVSKKVLYAVLVPIIVLVLVLVFLVFAYRTRKHLRAGKAKYKKRECLDLGPYSFQTVSSSWSVDVKLPTSLPIIIIDKPLLNLTFADLLVATSNFDGKTLFAEGRFGPVYLGVLPGEVHVDIKVLIQNSVLTDQEVATELERLGRIKHSNLVPLLGYCLAGARRIVVQEHMKNGNLHSLLHDSPIGCEDGDEWGDDSCGMIGYMMSKGKNTWAFRHRVALGIARGLAFLHHGCSPKIVHGDVQTSNILLDENFEPRFSDYGLAELVECDFVEENPYGSPGYMTQVTSGTATQCTTPESDVYAFGVVLFEIVTGKKPFDTLCEDVKNADMVSWARILVSKSLLSDAIDSRIWNSKQEKQMEEALKIAYLCTAEVPSKRPSMQQIVGLLKDIAPSDLH